MAETEDTQAGGKKKTEFITGKGVTLVQLDFSTATGGDLRVSLEGSAWAGGINHILRGSK